MTKRLPAAPAWVSKQVEVDDLLLDPQNPRLKDAGLSEAASQTAIIKALWEGMAVDEVALSIAANGFFPHEPLFAARENGKLYVIEGNRRLAAVKLLRDKKLSAQIEAAGIPPLTAAESKRLDTLPVIECSREDVWTFLGFKHINGPQAWDAYPKAHYIAWVRNTLDIPLEEIATRIGDKHSTVVRYYDALMVLQQAEKAGVFDREDRFKAHFSFSHLFTGLGYTGIRKFLGLPIGERNQTKESPVPKKNEKHLGEVLHWLYGSRKENQKPVVQSQNPDLRQLDEVLQSEDGVTALRKGLPLRVSLEISQGDERVFREALIEAKQNLQKARGTVLTGYKNDEGLMEMAREISKLISAVLDDMAKSETPSNKRPRSR